VLAVAALLITVLVRRALAQGRVDPRWEPGPEELGYVNGNALQAVTVSLAGLRAANAISVESGTITVIGSPPPAPSELTWAVYQAVQRSPMRTLALVKDRSIAPALAHLHDTLVRHGWLLSGRRRNAMRLAALPMFVVLALGFARVVAGMQAGKPVGFVVMLTVVVGILTLPTLVVSPRSRAGQSAMARTRAAHVRLDPRDHASAASAFGVGGAALAVGLFGAAALWSADPALAAETDLGRTGGSTESSGGDSGGGGSSCSGGSSCGGGGGGCGG
jgi:uncharacterized protein (TIGR04222 family)